MTGRRQRHLAEREPVGPGDAVVLREPCVEHGEIGFDYGLGGDVAAISGAMSTEPRPASLPPSDRKRYFVVVEGVQNGDLIKIWSQFCQPGSSTPVEFKFPIWMELTKTALGRQFLSFLAQLFAIAEAYI